MPVTRLVNLNNNAGAYTQIAATIPARSVQIVEDSAAPSQGLEVQYPQDGFATTYAYDGGTPIEVTGAGENGNCGLPAQNSGGDFNYRAADVYLQARSATATATTVRVVESETA
ncbi:MAG TPA: hypothetical protein VMV31_15080 [Terriglobales bacterium]|nr:hypothetical protein [Terriglobales bacterium]